MLRKIIKNKLFLYTASIIAAALIIYFLIAPFVLGNLFPQYAILNNYRNVEVCTDLPAGTPSSTFLSTSCTAIDTAHTIGCTYNTSVYTAPSRSTSDERLLCPLFVSANDARGIKNQALAVLPINQNTLQIILSTIILGIVIIIYIITKIILHLIKLKIDQKPVAQSNKV